MAPLGPPQQFSPLEGGAEGASQRPSHCRHSPILDTHLYFPLIIVTQPTLSPVCFSMLSSPAVISNQPMALSFSPQQQQPALLRHLIPAGRVTPCPPARPPARPHARTPARTPARLPTLPPPALVAAATMRRRGGAFDWLSSIFTMGTTTTSFTGCEIDWNSIHSPCLDLQVPYAIDIK